MTTDYNCTACGKPEGECANFGMYSGCCQACIDSDGRTHPRPREGKVYAPNKRAKHDQFVENCIYSLGLLLVFLIAMLLGSIFVKLIMKVIML